MKKNEITEELRLDAEAIEAEYAMTPEVRRQKLVRWVVRQGLTVVLYYFLWNMHPWVPLSLWVTVPLALLSLASVLFFNTFLKWRLNKAKASIQRLDDTLNSTKEEEEQP